MTTPNVDNTKTEYIKIQVPFANGSMPVYINSAFAAPQNYTVQNGNSVGEKLASGDVNPAENVAETNGTEQVEESKNQKHVEDNPLFLTDDDIKDIEQAIIKKFNSYAPEFQEQILKEYSCSNIQQLIERINVKSILSDIADGRGVEDEKGLKELLGDNYNKENVARIFSKEYFMRTLPDIVLFWTNLDPIGHYLNNLNEAANEVDLLSDNFAKIYHDKELDCRYDIRNREIPVSELSKKLGIENINDLKPQEQVNLIKQYFEKIIKDYKKANLEEKRDLIYNELCPFIAWTKQNNVDKSVRNALSCIATNLGADALKVILESAENNDERIDMMNGISDDVLVDCDAEVMKFLVQQLEEGGYIYNLAKEKGINPDALRAIYEKCKTPEDFENLSSEEKELLNKASEIIQLGEKLFRTAIQNTNVSDEDKQHMGETVGDFIGTEMGEESYRTWIEDLHNWYQENGENLNITPEQFEELMNGATHGNYQLIADGSSEPLYLPKSSGSESYEYASGAQNPETGFFNTQPQSVINYSQNNLAELRQSLIQSTASDTTPQLVKNESAQNIIQKGGDKKASLLTKYRQKIGNLSFIKEIFNNNVNFKDNLAVTMALNSFENIGKSMRLITFERINNSTGASLVMEEMSTDEKSEVHAQNIYIAEKLKQQVEEEEKKKQA